MKKKHSDIPQREAIENKVELRVQSFRFDAAISNGRLRGLMDDDVKLAAFTRLSRRANSHVALARG